MDMLDESTERELPQSLVDFARELCRVAKKNRIDGMSVSFRTGIYSDELKWPHPISVVWEQGRHGAKDDYMLVTSEVIIRTTIHDPLGAKLVTVPEPTEEQIEDAAKELWQDMFARLGGTWPGAKSGLASVDQCVATARVMLMAAWRPGATGQSSGAPSEDTTTRRRP